MEFEKIRQNRILRIVLIVLDLLSLLCVGYGKSKVSHPGGTVIDLAFLETVRKIVVHERFAQYGTICAICFLITTMLRIIFPARSSRYFSAASLSVRANRSACIACP